MSYNIYFDISAIVLILVISLHFFTTNDIRNQKTITFAHMLSITLTAAICDIAGIYLDNFYGEIPKIINYAVNGLYLINTNAMAIVYYTYIFILTKKGEPATLKQFIHIGAPFFGSVALILTTPLTKWVFYYNEENIYTHGDAFFILYMVSFSYLLSAFIRTLRMKKEISFSQTISVYGFSVLMLIGIVYQSIWPNLMVLQYGESLACLVILFSMENPADYREVQYDIYNSRGFFELYRHWVLRNKKFQVLAFRIEGLKEIGTVLGLNTKEAIVLEVIDYIRKTEKSRHIFKLTEEIFCIMSSKKKEDWKRIEDGIKEQFSQPFVFDETQVSLGVHMCMIEEPKKYEKPDDAIDLIRFALKNAPESYGDTMLEVDESVLVRGRRNSYILQSVKRALKNDGFEVFYQPIYSTKEGRYVRAEALVRLRDEKLGIVGPDEFIPLAEENGLITELGACVLSKVCQMLKEEELWEHHIERVDVNLSSIQCMQENLAERLIDMIDAYKIPYKSINLEITESAAIVSEGNLRKNMERLLQKGISFAMDDYGTGYSNTATLIAYPFADVKLDKTMIWSAMKNGQAQKALKYTIAMLREMGFEIIAEGIEDLEMANVLREYGCELHQGYFYSRPVPKEEFLNIVKNQ